MKNTLLIILAVIGALSVICVCGGVIGLIWLGSRIGPAEGIAVSITQPQRVTVGDDFDITIVIHNSLDKERTLKDIDFWDPLLEGVTVKSVDVVYESYDPDYGIVTYTFNQPIAPLRSMTITFTLTADKPGTYTGDLDVAVDHMLSITTNPTTIIIDPAN